MVVYTAGGRVAPVRSRAFRQISIAQIKMFVRIPGIRRMRLSLRILPAEVAELVDAHDSKSCSFGSEGSIPSLGTKNITRLYFLCRRWSLSLSLLRRGMLGLAFQAVL